MPAARYARRKGPAGGSILQRYQFVHAFIHATIAGLLYLFLRFVAVVDASPYADYIRGGAILVLPFLFNRSGFIANTLIEKVPLLSNGLRRLLSGSDFIEGDWPLVVLESDNKTPKYFGFLTISYERGQIQISGDDWKPDGTHAVHFASQQSRYANRKLEYWYAQGKTKYMPTMFGYTSIYFFPERGRIERHAGEFLDKEHTSPPFYSRRVKYKLLQRRLKSADEKIAAAKQLWADIETKIASRTDNRLDRDFI